MFDHIIGQDHIKERLSILIEYAKLENKRLPDLFFAGPGGVGKSTFSRAIPIGLGWVTDNNPAYAELNATSVKDMGQLISYMHDNIRIPVQIDVENSKVTIPRCVVFLDEVQKLKEPLKTELLNAMDERRKTTFKVHNDTVLEADFSEVTFIMASTDKNDLSDAFLSRFQIFELIPYTAQEIAAAVSKRTSWDLSASLEIGKRCKTVMRVAMLEIEAIKAFLRVRNLEPSADSMVKYYELKKTDDLGLDEIDYKMLEILNDSRSPLGLKAIATRLRRPEKEVESREGFLAAEGLIDKVSGGRAISESGRARLNRKLNTNQIVHTSQ
jgi:Holliday junction DNA helicase RuvB